MLCLASPILPTPMLRNAETVEEFESVVPGPDGGDVFVDGTLITAVDSTRPLYAGLTEAMSSWTARTAMCSAQQRRPPDA